MPFRGRRTADTVGCSPPSSVHPCVPPSVRPNACCSFTRILPSTPSSAVSIVRPLSPGEQRTWWGVYSSSVRPVSFRPGGSTRPYSVSTPLCPRFSGDPVRPPPADGRDRQRPSCGTSNGRYRDFDRETGSLESGYEYRFLRSDRHHYVRCSTDVGASLTPDEVVFPELRTEQCRSRIEPRDHQPSILGGASSVGRHPAERHRTD